MAEMTSHRRRLIVDLDLLDSEPRPGLVQEDVIQEDVIQGWVAEEGSAPLPFSGWLELASAVERARARPVRGTPTPEQ